MSDLFDRSGTFTRNAWEWLYNTVDHEQFESRDADLIYRSMEKDFRPVHFGRYLQHILFKKSGLEGDFTQLPLKDYQTIVIDAFRDNNTPPSFGPTTAKVSALAKNWLTQQSVKRRVVLLLGFGLKLRENEVNEFLYKVLHEPLLNDHNPFEAICKYCYRHGYGYYKFQQLLRIYEQMQPDRLDMKLIYDAMPAGRTESQATAQDDAKLMSFLVGLKNADGRSVENIVYDRFTALYDEARGLIAEQYRITSRGEARLKADSLRDLLSRSDRMYDCEKQDRIRSAEEAYTDYTGADITESDFEHILCSAIPTDRYGNLISARRSTLNAQFEGMRFSRQHINDILQRKTVPERFDLITLNFLIAALKVDREPNPKRRYTAFIRDTDRILGECFMGPLYIANPYECFVLMCLLSVSPLETYNEVIEKSYSDEDPLSS